MSGPVPAQAGSIAARGSALPAEAGAFDAAADIGVVGGGLPAALFSRDCVASASARAYWAGGATLGLIIAFAYRAARSADRQPARSHPAPV